MKTKTDPTNKGWFSLAGQDGIRDFKTAIAGIEFLAHCAKGASVLDLGCAEGLIGGWLLANGACHLSGVDYNITRIRRAKELFPCGVFAICDLNEPERLPLMGATYDIVLCLSVLQKLRNPSRFLTFAASRAERWLAIRVPNRVLIDDRSNRKPLDIGTMLSPAFLLASEYIGPPWVGVFMKCT